MFVRSLRRSLFVSILTLIVAGCSASSETRSGSGSPPSTPAPTAAPSALQAAHEAYLAGDFIAVTDRIRDVLLDPSSGELAKDNALELLDKAYEAQNGKLPSRFALPTGFDVMKLGFQRGQSKFGAYRSLFLFLRVREGLSARMSNIIVRRLPNELLLDKASERGQFRVQHYMPGFDDVVLEATKLDALPDDGVLSIRIDVDGTPAVDTWVLGRHLASSASPEVASPLPSTSLSDSNPTVRWTPFRSPEFAPYEERTLGVYVHDEVAKKAAWDYWTGEPGELRSIQIGDHAPAPKTSLGTGTYWLALTMGEERQFGPIRLARTSATGVPFNVVR